MADQEQLAAISKIEGMIHAIRGQRVMLDSDLAEVYGVSTTALNQAVKRNLGRFPEDFMFQLTNQEFRNLISQFVTSRSHGGRRKPPFVFTEHGAIMAANVLNSKRAVAASVQVVRAFVKLRDLLISNHELARKLDLLEKKYDRQFAVVFEAIRQLMEPPPRPIKRIGFKPGEGEKGKG